MCDLYVSNIITSKEPQAPSMESHAPLTFEEFHRQYKILDFLASGKFGEVFKIVNKITNTPYALKKITCRTQRQVADTKQEIQIMCSLDHPNIVKLLSYYRQNYVRSGHYPICNYGIVMELGQASLERILKDRYYQIQLKDVRLFLANLISVGAYLQSRGIVHRDIKPANLIIFGEALNFKIADFGLSCPGDKRPKGFAGTLEYSSPILQHYYHSRTVRHEPPSNPFKDEVFSAALTVEDVLTKINSVWEREKDQQIHRHFKNIYEDMLRKDERDRPTFGDLIMSEFYRQEIQSRGHQQELEELEFMRNAQPCQFSFQDSYVCSSGEEKRLNQIREQLFQPDLREKERRLMEEVHMNERETVRVMQAELVQKPATIMEHHSRQPNFLLKQQVFKLDYRIRTIRRLDRQFILCGDKEGNIIAFDTFKERAIELSLTHQRYVASVEVDEKGDIWSVGGDGVVYYFQRPALLNCLHEKTVRKQVRQPSLFKKMPNPKTKEMYIAQIGEKDYTKIQSSKMQNKPIVLSKCLTRQKYIFIYADGTKFIHWNGRQTSYFMRPETISSIQVYDNKLYFAVEGGSVNIFDLNTFEEEITAIDISDTVAQFIVRSNHKYLGIEAVTYEGVIQKKIISVDRSLIAQVERKNLRLDNLLGACCYEGMWLTLTHDGRLNHHLEQIIKFPGQGWNCIYCEDQWIVAGSGDKMIVLIQVTTAY